MGYYINPKDDDKLGWLKNNARTLTRPETLSWDFSSDELPLCLVDNGLFFALGICPDKFELDAFLDIRNRHTEWFAAKRDKLTPWYNNQNKNNEVR